VGDIAVINNGTVTQTGTFAPGLTVQLNGATSNGDMLVLAGATLPFGSHIQANSQTSQAVLESDGVTQNAGGVQFTGTANEFFFIGDGANQSAAQLINTGGISFVGGSSNVVQNIGTNAANAIVNDGVISARANTGSTATTFFNLPLAGTGTVRVGTNVIFDADSSVSAGQTFVLEAGAGASTLNIANAGNFHGVISGLGASDVVKITSLAWTTNSYSLSGDIGTWTFFNGATPVASISFAGGHAGSEFTVTPLSTSASGVEQAQITTSVPDQPARFAFTDVSNDVAGSEAGVGYTGPVAGLNWQYLWGTGDSVAISANTPNVFLKGGAGDDALSLQTGTNVVDGGTGSNFLVGSADPNSRDTFFVDGRGGGVTWSTIVNFHLGDQATIFGFHPTTSTLPITANDGVGGFQGVTTHSELNGAGTGVNDSMTFTGINQATLEAHFTFTTGTLAAGTPGAIDYLLIQYNH
jgi:hypothetical protein